MADTTMTVSSEVAQRVCTTQSDLILQHVDLATARSLSVVSRAFAAPAQKRLFRRLRLGYLAVGEHERGWGGLNWDWHGKWPTEALMAHAADHLRCVQVLDMLERKPYIATAVRELHLVVHSAMLPELARLFAAIQSGVKTLELDWFIEQADLDLQGTGGNLTRFVSALAACRALESVHLHYSNWSHLLVGLSAVGLLSHLRYLVIDARSFGLSWDYRYDDTYAEEDMSFERYVQTVGAFPLRPLPALESAILTVHSAPMVVMRALLDSTQLKQLAWATNGQWGSPEDDWRRCSARLRELEALGCRWDHWTHFLERGIDPNPWSMTTLALKVTSFLSEDVMDFFEGKASPLLSFDAPLRQVVLLHKTYHSHDPTLSLLPCNGVEEIVGVSQAMFDTLKAAPTLECVRHVESNPNDPLSGWRQVFGVEQDLGSLHWVIREYSRSNTSGDTLLHVRYRGYRRWPNLATIAAHTCYALWFHDKEVKPYPDPEIHPHPNWGHKAVMTSEIGWTEFLDYRGRPVPREVMDEAFSLSGLEWRQEQGGRRLILPEESWRVLEGWHESQYGRDATPRKQHERAWEEMNPAHWLEPANARDA